MPYTTVYINILILVLIILNSFAESSAKNCTPTMKILNCNNKMQDSSRWDWRIYSTYKILTDTRKGCSHSSLSYNWELYNDKDELVKRLTRPYFYLKRYTMTEDDYQIMVTVTEKSKVGGKYVSTSASCPISYKNTPPLADIRGGFQRTSRVGKPLQFLGIYSRDNDAALQIVRSVPLKFFWSCTVTSDYILKNPKENMCPEKTTIGKENRLIISGKSLANTTHFHTKLTVSTKGGTSSTTTQEVFIYKGARTVEILCKKNCIVKGSPELNFGLALHLQVRCWECKPAKSYVYPWIIEEIVGNDTAKVAAISTTEDLVLSPDYIKQNFKRDTSYYIGIDFKKTFKDRNVYPAYLIKTSPLSIKNRGQCSLSPTAGASMSTEFSVNCANFDESRSLTYMVYQKAKSTSGLNGSDYGLQIVTSPDPQMVFHLSHKGEDVYVKVLEDTGNYDIFHHSVMVFSSFGDKLKVTQLIDGTHGTMKSFKSIVKEGNIDKVAQYLNAIVDEIDSTTAPIAKKKLQGVLKGLVKRLNVFSLVGEYEYMQMASILAKLMPENVVESEMEYHMVVGELSRRVADVMASAEKVKFMTRRSRTSLLDETLVQLWIVAITNFKKSQLGDVAKIGNFSNNTLPELSPVEDYPSYDGFTDGQNKYVVSVISDALKTLQVAGHVVANTMTTKEDAISRENDMVKMTMKRISRIELTQKNIDMAGMKLSVSLGEPQGRMPSDVSYVIISIKKPYKPFWWHNDSDYIFTSVNDFTLTWDDGTLPLNRLNLYTDIDNSRQTKHQRDKVEAPADPKDWVPANLDYTMSVYRVNVMAGDEITLQVQSNDGVDVVIVPGRRPRATDFEGSRTNESRDITMHYKPSGIFKRRNSWCYIAILPSRKLVGLKNGTKAVVAEYTMKISTTSCVTWNWTTLDWSGSQCRIGRSGTPGKTLHCVCKTPSTFAAMYREPYYRKEKLIVVSFVLPFVVNYLIYTFTFLAIFGYCLILARKNQVIFLSDNVKNERYAYLLVVKTSRARNSGTTSNIGVKIFGESLVSKPHILNYPDPAKKFLQTGGEDYFLLATENHLGYIVQIKVWTDSVGVRSSWLCESIKLYDVQTGEMWLFNKRFWLSVLEGGVTSIILKPRREETLTDWKTKVINAMSAKGVHTWNLSSKTGESTKNYMMRVTMVLSILLTTFSLAIDMLGVPWMARGDAISYHPRFGLHGIIFVTSFFSSLISFFIHVGIEALFRYGSTKEYIYRLPSTSYTQAGWIALITSILCNTTFLVAFGFWVPHITSLMWTVAVGFALLQSILLLENAYMLVKNYLGIGMKVMTTVKVSYGRLLTEVEQQRRIFSLKFGDYLLRPYMRLRYCPLEGERLLQKRLQEKSRQDKAIIFKELLIYTVYAACLMYLVLGNLDYQMSISHNCMTEMVTGSFSKSFDIYEIEKHLDINEYLEDTLVAIIHPTSWYGGWELRDPGAMVDYSTRLLGVVQLRQLRVAFNTCTVATKMSFLKMSCEEDYSSSAQGYFAYKDDSRMSYIWERKTAEETGSVSSLGQLRKYPGDGFIARLGRNKHNTQVNLEYIRAKKWIDLLTRVVFVEFWTYNANYNIFHAVRMVIEKSSSGLFFVTLHITTCRLISPNYKSQLFMLLIMFLFVALTMRYVIIHLKKALRKPETYFRKVWNYIDILIILLSLICFFCYIHSIEIIGKLIALVDKTKHNQYIPHSTVFAFARSYTILSALLVCVVVIRLWKFLRFGSVFRLMENTLLQSFVPLMQLFALHWILLMSFLLTGHLLFGSQVEGFSTLTKSLVNILLLTINLEGWNLVEEHHLDYSKIYFLSFLYMSLLMCEFYVVVLMYYYALVTEEESGRREYTVAEYVKEEVTYYNEIYRTKNITYRLGAGSDAPSSPYHERSKAPSSHYQERSETSSSFYHVSEVPSSSPSTTHHEIGEEKVEAGIEKESKGGRYVYPKKDGERYADIMTVKKAQMDYMSYVARRTIRELEDNWEGKRLRFFTEKDMDLMEDVVLNTLKKDKEKKKLIFFVKRNEDNAEIVTNERILLMAQVADRIMKRNVEFENKVADLDTDLLGRLELIDRRLDSISTVLENIDVVDPCWCVY